MRAAQKKKAARAARKPAPAHTADDGGIPTPNWGVWARKNFQKRHFYPKPGATQVALPPSQPNMTIFFAVLSHFATFSEGPEVCPLNQGSKSQARA
jgi:hypothetical protein